MPRQVTPQADQHAQSPHLLEDHPDSAYGGDDYSPPRDPANDRIHHMDPRWDPTLAERWAEGRDEQLGRDEESGYNWGPPPEHHPDPGFPEVEDDPYPHA